MADEQQVIVRFSYTNSKGFCGDDKTKIYPASYTLAQCIAKGNKLAPAKSHLDSIDIELED